MEDPFPGVLVLRGECLLPSQEIDCNTLSLNLKPKEKGEGTCNPPISFPDSLSQPRHINN
jgi:hypothetical protein